MTKRAPAKQAGNRSQHLAVLCLLGIAAGSCHAQANWVRFSEVRNEARVLEGIQYVDAEGMHRNGNLVRAAFLTDFSRTTTVGNHRLRSWVWQFEFDCQRRQYRTTRVTYYAGQMGKGAVRHDSDTERMRKWEPVYDGALEELAPQFEYTCPGSRAGARKKR